MASRELRFGLVPVRRNLSVPKSGSVFTTSPEVDKTRADAIKTMVSFKVKPYGDFQKYEIGSSQHVTALTTAILQAAQFSMDSLRNLMGKPTRL
jgi:hypothetical protein